MNKSIYGEAGPALLSPDRMYRYTIERVWDSERPKCAFIGLNPSTADEQQLDPTLRRCVRFADSWGYGSLLMLNLFAFRSTLPSGLRLARDPVGPDNDHQLIRSVQRVEIVVCCWGAHGAYLRRGEIVREEIHNVVPPDPLYHLGLTKSGQPKHPLYLSSNLEPEPWQ